MARIKRKQPAFSAEDDAILRKIWDAMNSADGDVSILSVDRLMQFKSAYRMLQESIDPSNAVQMCVEEHTPFSFLSTIVVSGTRIDIQDMRKFHAVCRLADNFEVFAKTDGTIELTFGFYRMTEAIT